MTFPLTPTPLALSKMLDARKNDPELNDGFGIRVSVIGGGCSGFKMVLDFENEVDPEEDVVQEFTQDGGTIKLIIDEMSVLYLEGMTLDYVAEGLTEGFKFRPAEGKEAVLKTTCACGSSYGQ